MYTRRCSVRVCTYSGIWYNLLKEEEKKKEKKKTEKSLLVASLAAAVAAAEIERENVGPDASALAGSYSGNFLTRRFRPLLRIGRLVPGSHQRAPSLKRGQLDPAGLDSLFSATRSRHQGFKQNLQKENVSNYILLLPRVPCGRQNKEIGSRLLLFFSNS